MRSKLIAVLTAHAFLVCSFMAPVANAGIVTTGEYLQRADVDVKRAEILSTLQREEIRTQLMEMGVDADAVETRVAALSDAEVMQMAENLDSMPAGGDGLGAVVFVLLILLLLELLGVTDIFPAVDPA